MKVRCERDGTVFEARPLPYPSATCRRHDFNTGGDLRINCPRCCRSYFLHDAEHLSEARAGVITGPEPQAGDFVSDRVLTVVEP